MTADPIPVLTQSARGRGGAPSEGGAKHALARRQGRFGIRIKLLAAFAVVAAMTVVAAEVAIVSFSATERGVERVATQEVPVMTDALRLSATSGEISAAAARLVNAASVDEQRLIARSIARTRRTARRHHKSPAGKPARQRGVYRYRGNLAAARSQSQGSRNRNLRARRGSCRARSAHRCGPQAPRPHQPTPRSHRR